MLTIPVDVHDGYDVLLGEGLLTRAGQEVAARWPGRAVAVVTDDAVDALYGGQTVAALAAAGLTVHKFVFPQGEAHKSLATLGAILDFLAARRLTKSDVVFALGGGIVGDVAGFAAATYLRGTLLVQAPTTLLAMVDSSVGGKTAVNLTAGKNLAGAFYQPRLVLADAACLRTLRPETLGDGLAETVKYGVLADPELFAWMENGEFAARQEAIIARCVAHKRDYVRGDEYDEGKRQFLNLGHTIGHAIEKASGFAVTHGHAVAMGMAAAARGAAARGLCDPATPARVAAALARCDLPTECPYPAEVLLDAALNDKKRRGGTITLVLPHRVGECGLHPTPVAELGDFLRAALG